MRALAVVLLAAVAIAGCSDGDDGSSTPEDVRAIRETIRLSLTTHDPVRDCRERLSEDLIRQTYRTRARCVRLQRDDEQDAADRARVTGVEVDGDAARATVALRGGDSDGATGGLELVREDGDWRIDDLSSPLLRSLVEAGLRADQGEGGPLPREALDCIGDELLELSDARLRALAFELIGETPAAMRQVFGLLAGCEGEGGRSLLRVVFERGIVEGLRADVDEATIECIVDGLRARLSDDELAALLADPRAEELVGRAVTPVAAACARGATA